MSWLKSWLLVRKCRGLLSTFYLRQIDDHAWPPVKATNLINLALIKDQSSWRRTVQESVDTIIGEKESTSYHTIFSGIEYLDKKFILLEGRPGSGKTTLMKKISHNRAKGRILKSKLVIFILRRLNAHPDHRLATILRVACSTLHQSHVNKLASHIEKKKGEGIVFAFDGLDEYITHRQNEVDLDLLRGMSLNGAIILVTS